MDKYVGKRLDGRYEIQEIIGVGGMAVVYKAYDNVEDRTVAIKILKEEFVSNEEFVRRFKNESKAIAVLSHPNIVKVYDVSFGDLIQYIVMEYIDGITLKEYIERQGSLRFKDADYFAVQILKGLQHAHDKGIVHRDVKPQNIMVLSDGTIKVTDFGIARFARSEQRTITDKAIGSVHYISPEQARGEKTDEKSDIYSVGVMLYEMLTGELPFQAESAVSVAIMQLQRDPKLPTEINPSVPLGLEQITMHAMQKNPEKRYQSAAEMLCDLEQFKKDPTSTFDYSYFVDDSPTKFVGGTVISSTPASAVSDDYDDDESGAKEKSNIIPVLAGIAVALLVAIGVLLALFLPKLLSGTGAEMECPDFVGKTLEEIKNNEEYKNNFDLTEEWGHNADYEYGVVYDQSQKAGDKVKKQAKITLYVSMGQSTIRVPDVYGKNESYAVSELKSKGFKTVVTEIADDEVEAGLVIKTEPERTTVVSEGAEINIFISTGKEIKMVDVPNVVGLTKERAQADIKKAGLVAKIEERDLTPEDKYYEAGHVLAQKPDANSSEKVAQGSEIIVYVSTGKVKYNYEVTVEIPQDYEFPNSKLYLYLDGVKFAESEELDFTAKKQYVFKNLEKVFDEKPSAKDLELTFIVKMGEDRHDYVELTVDIETGDAMVTDEFFYPTADETSSEETPSEEG